MGDFDDVDKYRADARDLFSNVAALKDLEGRFPYLTEEQTEAVRRFWGSFRGERLSREQEEFLRVWERLYGTYERDDTGQCDGNRECRVLRLYGAYKHDDTGRCDFNQL